MNKISITICNRIFELNVIYHNYPGEEITDLQKETFTDITDTDFSIVTENVRKYIMKNDSSNISEHTIDNIFKYIIPKHILIFRDDVFRIFAIMCDYKFDMEHGIAIVFENKKFKQIVAQDVVL